MFDNSCKFLVENFSSDFATWLLGEPITLTELSPTELSLEPIRADALILRQSQEIVLHIEFQIEPKDNVPFRMADYRLRTYRRFPHKRMHQVVIYLKKTNSEKVYQNTFTLERTVHQFDVIRLWEQPTEIFLQVPGLLPLAVLSNTDDKVNTLQQVASAIDRITDHRIQSNLAGSAFILAGLVLEKEVVQRLLRRDIMRESVTYQALVVEIREELQAEVQQQVEAKVQQQVEAKVQQQVEAKVQQQVEAEVRHIAVNMLQQGLSSEIVAKVTGLTVEQVQQLQISEQGN